MPIIKSAKKRVRVAHKQSVQNAKTKKNLKSSIKSFFSALEEGKKVDEAQSKAQSAIDTAVKKGVLSKNKAARKKSQLNNKAKAVNGGKRKPATKTKPKTAKKSTAKKTPAKKTATKTAVKKPSTSKAKK